MYHVLLSLFVTLSLKKGNNRGGISYAHERLHRHNIRTLNLNKMLFESDRQSVENYRMNKRTFAKLCHLLKTGGRLKENRNISVEEMVISFFASLPII